MSTPSQAPAEVRELAASSPPTLDFAALARRRRALLILLTALLTLWTVWATAILPHLEPLQGGAQTLRSVGVRVLLWIVPCGLYARSQGLRMTLWPWYLQLPPSPRHWLLAALTIAAAGVAVSLDVARKLGLTPLGVWALLAQGETVAVPIPEFFEELVFRGIILTELLIVIPTQPVRSLLSVPPLKPRSSLAPESLAPESRPPQSLPAPSFPLPGSAEALDADRKRFWLANLTASLVFTGLHWPWWIFTQGFSPQFFMKTGGVFLISLVLGMLFVRSRSLWPAVALHWLNNCLSALASS
jgi:membrane protease YdiL (CAAX protease family)